MSEHEERVLAEAYSLGALDPPERKLFESHLGSCRICRDAVGGASVAVQAIALTAPREAPPKGSGDRLVALYRQQRAADVPPPGTGGRGGLGGTLAVAFALAALGLSGWGYHEHEKVSELSQKVDALEKQVEKCHADKAIIEAPDVQTLSLKPYQDFKGVASIAYSPTHGVAVFAGGMPAAPPGKCYKLWWSKDGGAHMHPMGTFQQPGIFIDEAPGGSEKTVFAISLETDPKVEAPTLPVMLPG